MSGPLAVSVGYAAIGGSSVLAGAVFSTRHTLGDRSRSLVHHAAAGTVLAGLVVDIFAKLLARPHQLAFTAVGMAAGLAAMLAIRTYAGNETDAGAGGLVPTVVTDIAVDGVLIGISAALASGTGLLFAVALAPEMGLLGVTAGQSLATTWPARQVIAAAAAVAAAITGAGALGWALAGTGPAVTTTVLGVGASVIVYLVLEELLREVHQTDTGPVEVAVLFGFFLPFFLAGTALR